MKNILKTNLKVPSFQRSPKNNKKKKNKRKKFKNRQETNYIHNIYIQNIDNVVFYRELLKRLSYISSIYCGPATRRDHDFPFRFRISVQDATFSCERDLFCKWFVFESLFVLLSCINQAKDSDLLKDLCNLVFYYT